MRILVSNDDGILAPGLAALQEVAREFGDVTVVAPDSHQSAAGHSITIRGPLAVRRVHVQGEREFTGTSVDGSPADAVRLALFNLLDDPPDLVLSGINAGANVGIHVFYSGTVAAAAEAAMFGIPAVALSSELTGGEIDFNRDADICRSVLRQLLDRGLGRGDLLNVNIPALERGRPNGIRVGRQSRAELKDTYRRSGGDRDVDYYEIADYVFTSHDGRTDASLLRDGYVTITPLRVDLTAHDRLEGLEAHPWEELP